MVRSEVNLNKNVVSIAQFSTPASTPSPPPFRKLLFFACFRFQFIIHFSTGGSADPICPYVRTPVDRTAAEQLLSPKLSRSSADADRNVMCFTAILVDASSRSYARRGRKEGVSRSVTCRVLIYIHRTKRRARPGLFTACKCH